MAEGGRDTGEAGRILGMARGFQDSRMLHAACKLRVPDLLAPGPATAAELAARTDTAPHVLERFLRALEALGIAKERDDGRFEGGPIAPLLRADHPSGLRDVVLFSAGDPNYRSWGELLYGLRTGRSPFRRVFGGEYFSWSHRHREEGRAFDRSMEFFLRGALPAILAAFDFSEFASLADVGGGTGSFIAALLEAHPGCRGILFDKPKVAASARRLIAERGLAGRCEARGGDFLKAVPPGAEAYVLKNILHDWNDAACVAILRNCARAAGDGGRILVVETVMGPGADPLAKQLDLLMFVLNPGGKERSLGEFLALFSAAGLAFERVVPCDARNSVIVARA